ncbi:hypothetical protein [Salinicola tamaricis]|uniref:hypothetical protein n=1 Tax=Salinicola tamaricis TaxID=1771309 RepID=UPI001F5CAAD8|nr:hypothetical protein [Salinicola tamaricis]
MSHGDVETPDTVYMHNCVHLASRLIHGRDLPAGHEVAAIHDHVLGRGKFRSGGGQFTSDGGRAV